MFKFKRYVLFFYKFRFSHFDMREFHFFLIPKGLSHKKKTFYKLADMSARGGRAKPLSAKKM